MKVLFKLFFVLCTLLLAHFYLLVAALGSCNFFIKRFRNAEVPQYSSPLTHTIVWATYFITTRLPWLDTCLIRSLSCITLLRMVGSKSQIHLGIREGAQAHAWVSDDNGIVLCDHVQDLDTYSELLP